MSAAREVPTREALAFVDQTIYANEDSGDDVVWRNDEVLSMLHSLRATLARPVVPVPTREQIARVIYNEGAYCGDCPYDGWDSCALCRSTVLGYAGAILALFSPVEGNTK